MSAKSPTTPKYNKGSPGVRRILKEAQEIASSPTRDFTAYPLEHNLFEWHFTLRGPPAPSPYAEGFYHGRIILSPNYPMRPPMFRFLTDSGRFEVNRDICLSISGFHEETWQPSWSIRLALTALRAFMDSDPEGAVGALSCTPETRRELARKSKDYKCSECGGGGEEEAMRISEDEEGASSSQEIPAELRFGYKDQMKPRKDETSTSTDKTTTQENPEPPTPQSPSVAQSSPVAQSQPQSPPPVPQPQQQQPEEDRQEPAMFIPFGTGQQPQQQAIAAGPGNDIPVAAFAGAMQQAAPRRIIDTTNEDRTNGYLDLAIGLLLSILVALVLRKI